MKRFLQRGQLSPILSIADDAFKYPRRPRLGGRFRKV